MVRRAWLAVFIGGLVIVPLAAADTTTQTEEGTILGLDVWITLDQIATGTEPVTLSWTSSFGGTDLDLLFYDENTDGIAYNGCSTTNNPESCTAPAGAAQARIVAGTGVEADYTFTYEYEV